MAISKVLSCDEFVQEFDNYNRGDNFSIAARKHLYDYFWDYSEGTGQDYELDVIAICCEWTEYSPNDMLEEYSHMLTHGEEADIDHLLDLFNGYTTVIPVPENNSYLVGNY